ncbi:MAG: TonB-dependent receptor [Pyrinomonadaceae bacterium]
MKNESSEPTVFGLIAPSLGKAGRPIATLRSLLVMSLLVFLCPVMISAQAVSGVTGTVTDANGGAVAGAQVTLTDTKTSRELTVTTNGAGSYTFNNVQPGDGYRLSFSAPGFQGFVIENVQLGVGRTETQDARLAAGAVAETVTVTSTAGDATLNTTDASIGNVIGRRQLRELPIQLRGSPAALIGLQPGAVGTNAGVTGTGLNANRLGSVTGSRADQGNITVDGIDANDVTTGQAFATVANAPIDSIQEFRGISVGPNASEGRSSGGQIILSSNSGTNEFHGNMREYYRNEETAANSFFNNRNGVDRAALRRHQYGGSIGGPVPIPNFGEGGPTFLSGKDRLFFFFDLERRRDRSQQNNSRTVPLQSLRDGRIGYIRATPVGSTTPCPANSRLDTRPDCIEFLTPAQITALDPQGRGFNQELLSFINSRYPQANDLTGGNGINTGLFRFNAPFNRNDSIYTGRVDANLTDNQRLFVRTTITRRDSTNVAQQFSGDADAQAFLDKSYAIAGGHTWTVTPALTNMATVGLSKSVNIFSPADAPSFPNSFTFGAGLTAPFASLSYQDRNVFVPTIRDDVSYTTGKHSFQFGGVYKPIRQNPSLTNDFNFVTLGIGGATTALNASLRPANIRGGSVAPFDAAFAFALGRIAQVATNFTYDTEGNASPPGSGRTRSYAYNEYELYFQDNWKVRNDLTLNLGVRYHLYPAPYEVNGFQAANNVDFQELVDLRIRNAANGILGAGAEPLTSFDLNGRANNGDPLYATDKNNFAPRLGFAYNPSFEGGVLGALFGNKKTVLRGNASVVYDRVGGGITFIQDQSNFIFDTTVTRQFGAANARTALANDPRFTGLTSLPVQNVAETITRPFTPFVDSNGIPFGLEQSQTNYVVAKDFKIPYSYTFNVGMQRELPGNLLLDVSYVGRLGRKLFTQADAAQTLNFRDAASGQFLFDALNAIQPLVQANVAANRAPAAGLTAQPWLENQLNAASLATFGVPCSGLGQGANCTEFVTNFQTDLVRQGGTGDLIQQLYANGLLRPNVGISAQFGLNSYVTNLGSSSYHGGLFSVQKRLSHGFEFELNYTFSHSIDNQSSVVNTTLGGLLCDVTNTNACRGDSDFDIRHLFNANYIVNIPFGRGRAFGSDMPKWLDAIVGGFTLSGIVGARSGFAINSASGAFPVSFAVNSPAIVVGDRAAFSSNIREEGGGIQFFDDPAAAEAALRFPRHGEIGSRNTFRSPAFVNFDLGLSKRFTMPWSETHRITLRADAFNVTNTNSFSTPNLTLESPSFGRITGSLSTPRELQFAIRYDF